VSAFPKIREITVTRGGEVRHGDVVDVDAGGTWIDVIWSTGSRIRYTAQEVASGRFLFTIPQPEETA
jgi:hypothetical protein